MKGTGIVSFQIQHINPSPPRITIYGTRQPNNIAVINIPSTLGVCDTHDTYVELTILKSGCPSLRHSLRQVVSQSLPRTSHRKPQITSYSLQHRSLDFGGRVRECAALKRERKTADVGKYILYRSFRRTGYYDTSFYVRM